MTPGGKRVLVIGQGSIGARHRDVLQGLGYEVLTVSRRADQGRFSSIEAAMSASDVAAAVIATETAHHAADFAELARLKFTGRVLVEKPLVAQTNELEAPRPQSAIFVGYNLRFMPVVQELRAALLAEGGPCIAARLHVGQALDTWRPGRDRALVYSAYRGQGGGMLRDLSHELDLALWLFGAAMRVAAVGGRYTDQTVDSDDTWSILAVCERCAQVTVTLNGIDMPPSRYICVTTASRNYRADLISGVLSSGETQKTISSERNESYRRMWQALLSGGDAAGALCDWTHGAAVVHLIAAIEVANEERRWVDLAR